MDRGFESGGPTRWPLTIYLSIYIEKLGHAAPAQMSIPYLYMGFTPYLYMAYLARQARNRESGDRIRTRRYEEGNRRMC